MSDERITLRAAFLAGIDDEIKRRRAARIEVSAGNAKDRLLATFKVMGERMRSAPGFVEPSPAQQRHIAQKIERWLRRRGYGNSPLAE
jgi:hypothetical protein